MDYFTYNDGKGIAPDDSFRISPSQLSRYFDTTSQWYREFLLGEAPAFTGSTASELGNVVHAAAAMYHDTKTVDRAALSAYIDTLELKPDIDTSVIRFQCKPMIETLVNNFLVSTPLTHSEEFIYHQLIPGVGVGGSIDAYDENAGIIYDYKTMGSLDKARVPKVFPRNYWFQQLCYAYILRQQGRKADYCKLVYISRDNTGRTNEKGKPLKDYPSELNIVTHMITDEDMDIIHGCLMTIAHSVTLWNTHPELRYALAQDFRLYTPPKLKMFKE